MSLCENDKIYITVLRDKWVYQARKQYYWRERLTKLPGAPTSLLDLYERNAELLLERAWELAVHCDILTEELRFWKAWREEELRIIGEEMDKDDKDLDPEYVADMKKSFDKPDFFDDMLEVQNRFIKLGMERSRRS